MNGWQRKHGICAQCSNKFYESLHVTDPDWNVWTTKRNEMSRLQSWWYDNITLCENCESEYTKMTTERYDKDTGLPIEDVPQIAPPANSNNIELAYIDDDGVSHFRYIKQSEYEYLTVDLHSPITIAGWKKVGRLIDGRAVFRRLKR